MTYGIAIERDIDGITCCWWMHDYRNPGRKPKRMEFESLENAVYYINHVARGPAGVDVIFTAREIER